MVIASQETIIWLYLEGQVELYRRQAHATDFKSETRSELIGKVLVRSPAPEDINRSVPS